MAINLNNGDYYSEIFNEWRNSPQGNVPSLLDPNNPPPNQNEEEWSVVQHDQNGITPESLHNAALVADRRAQGVENHEELLEGLNPVKKRKMD